jgi:hypothetical protein
MPTYLLQDDFTTTESAPLTSPRTCEPGPGTLVLTDTAGGADASISGGKYLRPRPTSGQGFGNYGCVSSTSFPRLNGLMGYAIAQSSLIDRCYPVAFHGSSVLAAPDEGGVKFETAAQLKIQPGAGSEVLVGTSLTINTDYQTAVILRGNGSHCLIRGGSQFSSWTLLYVSMLDIAPVVYVSSSNFNADLKHDTLRVLQKSGSLATEYGKALVFSAIPETGDTATGAADALEYFTWTPVSGETLSLYFRRSTDGETYRLDCAQTAGTIKLYRRTGAVDTELDSGKTQTWTVGTNYRIGIMHAGGEIRTFVEIGTGSPAVTAKHAVTGETFNLSTTGSKVSGFTLGANWEIWPRTFSGTDETDIA